MFGFKQILDAINKMARTKTMEVSSFTINKKGNFNEIYFPKTTLDVQKNDDKEITSLGLAVSMYGLRKDMPKYRACYENSVHSRELLRKYNIRSPFILEYLSTDKQGTKIMRKEKYELNTYLRIIGQKKIEEATAKKLMGQLILGIKALHEKNVVHGDLKPENILISEQGNIIICDLDNLLEVNVGGEPKNKEAILVKTRGYAAPELSFKVPYSTINAKAADIFSYGQILSDILRYLTNFWESPFYALALGAVSKNPKNRFTIEMIMNHRVWGKTQIERREFFAELEREATNNKPSLFSGGFLITANPDEGDFFNLMPPRIKGIAFELERLNNKVDFISDFFAGMDANNLENRPLNIVELNSIRENADALLKLIDPILEELATDEVPYQQYLQDMKSSIVKLDDKLISIQFEELKQQKKFLDTSHVSSVSSADIFKLNMLREKSNVFTDLISPIIESLKNSDNPQLEKFLTMKAFIQYDLQASIDNATEYYFQFEQLKRKLKLLVCEERVPDIFELDTVRKNADAFLGLINPSIESLEQNKASLKTLQPLRKMRAFIETKLLNVLNKARQRYFESIAPKQALSAVVEFATAECIKLNKPNNGYFSRLFYVQAEQQKYEQLVCAEKFLKDFKTKMQSGTIEDLISEINKFISGESSNQPTSLSHLLKRYTKPILTPIQEAQKFLSKAEEKQRDSRVMIS